jgi:hypothetical protein
MLFATVGACVFAVAPVTSAAPECVNVGPTTTQCQTNGSSQIVTSPAPINNWGGWGPYWGGGLVIGLGDFGW